MVLLIDNYDSFVHNLARHFRRLGQATHVVRNDAITLDEVVRLAPRAIVLSPGPCTPNEAGCSLDLVRQLGEKIPILGVCLGHQTIAAALGGKVIRALRPLHGQSSRIEHNERGIFAGLPSPLDVGRYHSLIVERESLPAELEVTAQTDDGVIMGLAHREWPVFGVQFHPESILTSHGYGILENFLRRAGVSIEQSKPITENERPPIAATGPLPAGPVTF
jgi:anthranilate synthase/aminodeoxychorismate synthase-like glutamine amidotransferase